MKYFFIIALLFPGSVMAQPAPLQPEDCKLNRETDPYTKETRISTGFITLQGGSVTIDAGSGEIDIFFSVNGNDKCFDNNSTAAVFFEGTKLKMSYRNGGTMNCEGFFHFIFKNTAGTSSVLQRLTTQKITSILFTGNNKAETRVTLTPEQQQVMIKLSTCLVNEAKTLLK
jgi:hypothetical protein